MNGDTAEDDLRRELDELLRAAASKRDGTAHGKIAVVSRRLPGDADEPTKRRE